MSQQHAGRHSRPRRAGLGVIAAVIAVGLIPGAADAAKKKSAPPPDRARVMSYNLYLGSDLNPAIAAAASNPGDLSQFDSFANEVGFILNDLQANNFPVRARQIARDISTRKTDLVGLQEAALFRRQIPTDGGAPSATAPTAQMAESVIVDYIDVLLTELNKDAKSGKQCKQMNRKRKAAGKKPKDCYRGYRLVYAQQEADVEFPGDFDNNPGPDGLAGKGPGLANIGGQPAPGCATGGTSNNFDGNDDTGVGLGDPPLPGFPAGFNSDFNGDAAPANAGPAGCAEPDPPGTSDCQAGSPPLDTNPDAPLAPGTDGATCLFHGIDGDARMTLRDAILARKGAKVKTQNVLAANYKSALTIPVFGGASQIKFDRGWISTDVNVRGKKFRFLNTHLESESVGTIREDQAAELVVPGGVGTVKPTVLVGDLNSDPRGSGDSPLAIQELYKGGFFNLNGGAFTFGHGELLNDQSDTGGEERIDHIMANDPRIAVRGRRVIDPYANGLWSSDHAATFAAVNISKK